MGYRYRVVPFIGQTKGRLSPADVAKQLEGAISQQAAQGWEFVQLSDVNIEIQPGCISALFGVKVQYVRFDQLIFRGDERAAVVSPPTIRPSASVAAASALPPDTDDAGQDEEVVASPFCYYCGAEVALAATVCESCGKRL